MYKGMVVVAYCGGINKISYIKNLHRFSQFMLFYTCAIRSYGENLSKAMKIP
jgi:hypothetical protein